ncbi:MAG: altronate dehydratase [Clostridia bacterium]|nr:altronate dehydratase [Clostridia bacterium]
MRLHPRDNVEVDLSTGHKVALCDIAAGETVVKYGFSIGHATQSIQKGEAVHSHNLATDLSGTLEYRYEPVPAPLPGTQSTRTFMGYLRKDGSVGIRNDIWIVNTVGCVNKTAQLLAERTGAFYFPHPFGCSQLGDDMKYTQQILKGMVNHPNAGGVLVLGLGCENNNLEVFREVLGEVDADRVKFLNAQDVEDELAEGERLIGELRRYADTFERTPQPLSALRVGLKCGGSDAYSGITANPLVGRFSDLLIEQGGTTVLTEVPEMFGAEQVLMQRCVSREVFDKTVALINDLKTYFIAHGQPVGENPSPGNKAGGITTLEEKSLGCVQKGGVSAVTDVLQVGERITKNGVQLLNGPGNDIVAITNLMAAGVQLILFTTGRGTPVGAPVPTIKIATNSRLAKQKPSWIDFDAGVLLDDPDLDALAQRLTDTVVEVANGAPTCNEKHGYREISIFKDGVIL